MRVFKRLAVGAVGNRTYRERRSRPEDRGISIARDLLSRSLFSHLIAIRSFNPTKDAISDSAQYTKKPSFGENSVSWLMVLIVPAEC